MKPCCEKFNGASFVKDTIRVCRYCQAPVPKDDVPCFEMDRRTADKIDGYDRDDLGESPDY